MVASRNPRKVRLDVLLVERGLAESREQAQRLILAGQVLVAGLPRPKAGQKVADDIQIEVRGGERYVSRGGLKLEAALEQFGISCSDKVCADIGASTGGFSDCMLQHGAARVYAVDVGRSQLHPRLRQDARVVLAEQLNARELTAESLAEPVQLIAVDVSFISLRLVLPCLGAIATAEADAVILVKPQFEATRPEVSRGRGIIRDPAIHRRVLHQTLETAAQSGWQVLAAMVSPIAGGSGNREFLLHLRRGSQSQTLNRGIDIDAVVAQASM